MSSLREFISPGFVLNEFHRPEELLGPELRLYAVESRGQGVIETWTRPRASGITSSR